MTKKNKHLLGITLIISACSMVISFLVECCKKRNARSTFLGLAFLEGIAGMTLVKGMKCPFKKIIRDEEIDDCCELFEEEDADSAVEGELSHKNEGDGACASFDGENAGA